MSWVAGLAAIALLLCGTAYADPAPEAEGSAAGDRDAEDQPVPTDDPESPEDEAAEAEAESDSDGDSDGEKTEDGFGDEETNSILDDLLSDVETPEAGWGSSEEEGTQTYPFVEHSGYFRFRADLFYRPNIGIVGRGTGGTSVFTSGLPAPINRNEANSSDNSQLDGSAKDSETIAGANIRLRYSPTIHIQDWLRVHSTFDILDNLVLGSTPDYAPFRPDSPITFFNESQAPPADLRNSVTDSVRVKEAFGEVQAPFGNLRFGRMANHWGLGILANGGTHLDSDFGDFVDRVMFTASLWGVYVGAAWDFMGEGLLAVDQNQYFGQPYDATQLDDVIQVMLQVYQRPTTDEELDRRQRLLNVERKPVFDWGAYFVFRQQEYDAAAPNQPTYAPTVQNGNDTVSNLVNRDNFDDFRLVKRGAWMFIPDLWGRLEYRPNFEDQFRLEFEAVFIYGEIEKAVDSLVDENGNVLDASLGEKTILQWGGVVQGQFQRGGLSVDLEIGAASGDSSPNFGVLDQATYATGDQALPANPNRNLTNFVFDRNYYVDLIMFRETVGAVTNAVYVKPSIQYDLFSGITDSLGGRVDIITAWALEPDATPGQSSWYGVEFDAQIFYEEKNRFRADLSWGTYVPGSAFDLKEGFNGVTSDIDAADFSMTVQGRFFLMF